MLRCAFVFVLFSSIVSAATYQVGPTRAYANLSSLPSLNPGDVVEIDSGTYAEVRRWQDSGAAGNPIVVRGVGSSRPVFDATGLNVNGSLPNPRAVFQVEASYITIENIEFINARNGSNGAGIRVTGSGTTDTIIRNCKITYCDMGMMSNSNNNLLVECCEIAYNGTSSYSGYSHNLYLAGNRTTIQYSYVHDSLYGQNVKSRGHYTELLYNYIADSKDGEIGLVDSSETVSANSNAVLVGNIIISKDRGAGWNSQRFIQFGHDVGGSRNGTIYAFNNTLIAGTANIRFFDMNHASSGAVIRNNILYGSNYIVGNTGAGISGSNNWASSSATVPAGLTGTVAGTSPGFANTGSRDLHIVTTSACRNAGTASLSSNDGSGSSQASPPTREYVNHTSSSARGSDGTYDIGAYEYANLPPVIDSAAWASPSSIVLPATTSVSVVAHDPEGEALTHSWVQTSGPGAATFTDESAASTDVSFSTAGSYGLEVTISDPHESVTSSVTVTVNSLTNSTPTANDQSVTAIKSVPKTITLTGSDSDGDSLVYSVVVGPTHGSLSGVAPNLTYAPDSDYTGIDSFTFRVNDGHVDSASATVSITVVATAASGSSGGGGGGCAIGSPVNSICFLFITGLLLSFAHTGFMSRLKRLAYHVVRGVL